MSEIGMLREVEAVRAVGRLAERTGGKAYLVGGCLRDALLGREGKDFDFALDSAWEELPQALAREVEGSFFWLDRERGQSRVVAKEGERLLTLDFAPLRGSDIAADLALRDFTINALAIDLGGEGGIIDPLGGQDDIRRRTVRACSGRAFADDPLRMLRAFRFAAVLGFSIDEGTLEGIPPQASLLAAVAGERLRDEFFRLLHVPGAPRSLRSLSDAGLLDVILQAAGEGGAEKRAFEAGAGIVAAVEEVVAEVAVLLPGEAKPLRDRFHLEVQDGVTVVALLKLAAFLKEVRHLAADAVADRLRLGKSAQRILEQLCGQDARDYAKMGPEPTLRARYRFFGDREPAGPELPLLALAMGEASRDISVELITYYLRDYVPSGRGLLLSGDEVMKLLGLTQGRAVGEAMDRLREAEATGLVNTREDARAFLAKNLLTTNEPIR